MTATLTHPSEQSTAQRGRFSPNTQTYDYAPATNAGIPSAPWLLATQGVLEQRIIGHTTSRTVHLWYLSSFETQTSLVLTPVTLVSPFDLIKKMVIARFSSILQVAYIFCDVLQSIPVFSVFVEGEHYDDAVMDQLLDAELAVQQQFVSLDLSFNYLPHTGGSPKQTLRDTAQCVFERIHGRSD